MLFNSYLFLLVFLPAALVIYRIADPYPQARIPVLLALSVVFYAYWDVRNVALLIPSIVINWLAAMAYIRTQRSSIITTAIVLNLAVLAVFKYSTFINDNLALIGLSPLLPVTAVLPLGISFFSFHHIMYLADLRKGSAPEYPLGKYGLYICFFPQVLSGPLVRWSEVMHQFGRRVFEPGWERTFVLGVVFIVVGLAQKVFLGDPLAGVVNPVYERAASGPVTAGDAWLAVLGFSFQIFFDFSGYSDIAIGLGLLFGVQLPLNFDAPYRSASLQDFWRRWHMTLSRFLRDYLYIPLGGNRSGLLRQVLALIATMTLGGLWHGAGWPFIVWGLLHGLGLVVVLLWSRHMPKLPSVLGWFITFAFVTVVWVFFRSPSFEVAAKMLNALVSGPLSFGTSGWRTVAGAAAVALLLPASHRICHWLASRPNPAVAFGLAVAAIACMVELGTDSNFDFIYFRF